MHPRSRSHFRAVGYDHPHKFRVWISGKARGVTAIPRKMMWLAQCAARCGRAVAWDGPTWRPRVLATLRELYGIRGGIHASLAKSAGQGAFVNSFVEIKGGA